MEWRDDLKKPKEIDDIFNYDEYKSYIFSNVWDQKRNERLLFDDYKCALCGNRKSGGDSSCLSVTVGFCAAVQCAEAVKMLLQRSKKAESEDAGW